MQDPGLIFMLVVGNSKFELFRSDVPINGNAQMCWLVITPGISETNLRLFDALAAWLTLLYSHNCRLKGIIFLHQIFKLPFPREEVVEKSRRALTIFKDICGSYALKHVVVVTNFCQTLEDMVSEDQLTNTSTIWAEMRQKGCQLLRHRDTADSAKDIVNRCLEISSQGSGMVLELQAGIVDNGMSLVETQAGKEITGVFASARILQGLDDEIADMKKRRLEALESGMRDLAKLRQERQSELESERLKKKEKLEFECLVKGVVLQDHYEAVYGALREFRQSKGVNLSPDTEYLGFRHTERKTRNTTLAPTNISLGIQFVLDCRPNRVIEWNPKTF